MERGGVLPQTRWMLVGDVKRWEMEKRLMEKRWMLTLDLRRKHETKWMEKRWIVKLDVRRRWR